MTPGELQIAWVGLAAPNHWLGMTRTGWNLPHGPLSLRREAHEVHEEEWLLYHVCFSDAVLAPLKLECWTPHLCWHSKIHSRTKRRNLHSGRQMCTWVFTSIYTERCSSVRNVFRSSCRLEAGARLGWRVKHEKETRSSAGAGENSRKRTWFTNCSRPCFVLPQWARHWGLPLP